MAQNSQNSERYVPNGTPVTDHEREILTILIEECVEVTKECAEVAHAAAKLLRFGRENRPDGGMPNTEALGLEMGDLRHMMERSVSIGLAKTEDIQRGAERKEERLRRYLQTSGADDDRS